MACRGLPDPTWQHKPTHKEAPNLATRTTKRCTHRGARTHDHKVKGLALCRLSWAGCCQALSRPPCRRRLGPTLKNKNIWSGARTWLVRTLAPPLKTRTFGRAYVRSWYVRRPRPLKQEHSVGRSCKTALLLVPTNKSKIVVLRLFVCVLAGAARTEAPPAGLEPAIFALEVRRLAH